MFDVKKCLKLKNVAVFAGGVLFGTAGVKVLGSQDAKKLYINCLTECFFSTCTVDLLCLCKNILSVCLDVGSSCHHALFCAETCCETVNI